jgi:transcriptional antiterminator RfaH
MPKQWYALRAKPHKERSVLKYFENEGHDAFLPMVRVTPKNPRASKWRPFFPGYMFIHVDLEAIGANFINWTPGAHGLVEFGGEPAVVPPNLIDELQRRVHSINREGGLLFDGLKKGDRVRIVKGPLEGYEAIFDERLAEKDRVQVLLAFLSKYPQPTKLHADDIAKI